MCRSLPDYGSGEHEGGARWRVVDGGGRRLARTEEESMARQTSRIRYCNVSVAEDQDADVGPLVPTAPRSGFCRGKRLPTAVCPVVATSSVRSVARSLVCAGVLLLGWLFVRLVVTARPFAHDPSFLRFLIAIRVHRRRNIAQSTC